MLTLRSLLFTGFLFVTALAYGAIVLLLFWAPGRLQWALCVNWCRLSVRAGTFFCGLKVVVEGRENIPTDPSVIMIKHTTALETYWQVTEFPRASWVIKRELLWVPLFGWAIGMVFKPIAINRKAGGTAVRQVIDQGEARLNDGLWVTIFPEGTRMPAGETRRYGASGAALAINAGVKIVPVAHNAGDFWPRRGLHKRPGTVRFRIGEPIDPAGKTVKEVNAVVQEWIETTMLEISDAYQVKRDKGL